MLRSIRARLVAAIAVAATLAFAPVTAPALHAESSATAVAGLTVGARGDAVKSVQQALVNQGITVSGGVDGIFGPGTESALKQFQKQRGLATSGAVDDATALALGLASSPVLGLSQGVRGDAVKQLQQALTSKGITVTGGVDGIFGPGTTAAVKKFQKQRKLGITGTVDAATAAALGTVTAKATAPPKTSTPAPTSTDAGSSSAPKASGLVGVKIGSRGKAVETVQLTLMNAGFTVVGGADGIFGVLTSNALRSFQNANGLKVTGVVNAATSDVLILVGTGSSKSADPDPSASSPLLGLRYGSIGADVKALQQSLIAAGLNLRGGADGVFGTATLAAVKEYQTSRGLSVTGKIDDKTANALASGAGSSGGSASAIKGLKAGALGNTVKQLQQALIKVGVNVRGGADGIFGPATASALKDFQRSQGLEATGVVDKATIAALANPKKASTTPAPSSGGYAEFGEKGARVLSLQSALVQAGITVRGGVDGDYGGGTSAAVMDFQRREGSSVTGKVNDATATALGLSKAPAPAAPDPSKVLLKVFPVERTCGFADSWGYPRSGGRVHQGVDIIAPAGRLVYAAVDGKISKIYADYPGSLSGNGVRLTMADGTYLFYAHMTGLNTGIELGVPVKAGHVLGTVGSTGNTDTPHLHFEVHPQGGAAVNPYPLVKAIDGCK